MTVNIQRSTRLPPIPSAPPSAPRKTASATISPITRPLEKPSVLSTAISVRRSRTAMLIVFAVTSRIVKLTARAMLLSRKARLPAIAMKPAAKACSVSVSVCASVFSNWASMALLTAPAWFGSLISTV